jgi:predicted permease
MVLVRSTTRRREWVTRLALGARAGRLLRQSLVESWLLSAAGSAGGLLLGVWALTLAPSLGLDALPRGTEIAMDRRALVFLVAVASLVGTALGLLPLAVHRSTRLATVIREEGRTGTAGRAGRAGRRVLAAAQVACALILLVAGGVLLASLQRVLAVDVGFRSERLLTAQMNLPATRYPASADLQGFVDRLLARVRQLPGVEAAGISSATPFGQPTNRNVVLAEGYQMAPGESLISVHHVSVSDGYFETIGARLVAGRWFDDGDIAGRRPVIIIDERLARRFFPGGDAIGRRMWPTRADRIFQPPPEDQKLTVVGVVAEVRLTDVVDDPGVRSNGVCFYPNPQWPARAMGLAVRTSGEPSLNVRAVRRALADLDPELPFYNVDTVANLIDRSVIDRRTPALVAAGFAVVALFLAALGVYGVLAYQVAQRTRELGIRMALGADAHRIFRLVFAEGGLIVGVGALAGLAGATLLRRTLETQIYGIGVLDPTVLMVVVGGLAVVSLLAVTIPARRAARTDPTVALTDV